MELVIVTGLSGAGKTSTLNILEDEGFQCVDNLPLPLINDFVSLMEKTPAVDKVALALDQRGRVFSSELFNAIKNLKNKYDAKVLFLNASDETLIKRFKEKRRLHPLSKTGSITEGVQKERNLMRDIVEISIPIDTTNLNLGELKEMVHNIVMNDKNKISVIFTTFGFKNGLSLDSDLVFDVRFIKNPYYIPDLRYKSGYNEDCYNYVLSQPETPIFIEKVSSLLEFLIPYYEREGKEQLIVSFGCTGGRQRSVSVARKTADILKAKDIMITIINRDLGDKDA